MFYIRAGPTDTCLVLADPFGETILPWDEAFNLAALLRRELSGETIFTPRRWEDYRPFLEKEDRYLSPSALRACVIRFLLAALEPALTSAPAAAKRHKEVTNA